MVNSRSYEYTKGVDNYIDKSSGKEKFGYINQDISVKYAYIPNMKSIFQISFEPNISGDIVKYSKMVCMECWDIKTILLVILMKIFIRLILL